MGVDSVVVGCSLIEFNYFWIKMEGKTQTCFFMAAFSSYTLFNSSILFLYNSSFASVYTFIGGERHLLSSVGMCSWSKSQFLHSFLLTLLHTLCIFAILIDSFPFNQIHLFLALLCVIWFLIVEWSPPIRWYYSDSDPIVFSIQNGGIFFSTKGKYCFLMFFILLIFLLFFLFYFLWKMKSIPRTQLPAASADSPLSNDWFHPN